MNIWLNNQYTTTKNSIVFLTISKAGLHKSSILALKAIPKNATVISFSLTSFFVEIFLISFSNFLKTYSVLYKLTSRDCCISFATFEFATINQGSTAIQCPPTPGPGCKILTLGCLFAISMSSQGFILFSSLNH